MTHAETLTACLQALNSPHMRPFERRAGIAWLISNKSRLALLLRRTLTLIAERENDPNSLENWASRQRVSRATQALTSDLSAPTRFWAKDYQTTI